MGFGSLFQRFLTIATRPHHCESLEHETSEKGAVEQSGTGGLLFALPLEDPILWSLCAVSIVDGSALQELAFVGVLCGHASAVSPEVSLPSLLGTWFPSS